MSTTQLDFVRKGGQTRRFHTYPILQEQNVAEHSHGVAMMAAWLAEGRPSAALLMAALCHDLAEHIVGDMPHPAKRAMPDYYVGERGTVRKPFSEVFGDIEQNYLRNVDLDYESRLTPEEQRWLALADTAECGLFCIRERLMGNRMLSDVMVNVITYMAAMLKTPGCTAREEKLFNYIGKEWEKACG